MVPRFGFVRASCLLMAEPGRPILSSRVVWFERHRLSKPQSLGGARNPDPRVRMRVHSSMSAVHRTVVDKT